MESDAWLNALSNKNAENLNSSAARIDVPTGSNSGQSFHNRKDDSADILESLASIPMGTSWNTNFATSSSVKEAWSHQSTSGSSPGKSGAMCLSKKERAHVYGDSNLNVNIESRIGDQQYSFSKDSHLQPSLDSESCTRTKSASIASAQYDSQHSEQAWGTSSDKGIRDRKADGWFVLRELAKSNLSNSASAKSKMLTPNPSNLSEKGTARKGADESQECVIEDLEKDSPTGKKDKSGEDVPKITVDSLGTPVVLSSFRKKEDAAETRRRKLKMKMKHSNAFKNLFHSTRFEGLRATLQLGSCYNPEGIKIAKTSPHRETYVLNRPSMKSVNEADSKLLNYGLAAESRQYMAPSESIKIMKETLDKKNQYYFGEQTWLLGRLALSKETSRFEVPMDLRIMEKLSPMGYLTGYCVISSRRKSLYKSIFHKVDKDRDGFIPYSLYYFEFCRHKPVLYKEDPPVFWGPMVWNSSTEDLKLKTIANFNAQLKKHRDLIRAVKEIHVHSIDENEVNELSQILNLDDSLEAKYNCSMFAGVAAFSERLVIHLRSMCGKVEHSEKDKLESADFENLKWKLRTVNVNPALMKVLQVL